MDQLRLRITRLEAELKHALSMHKDLDTTVSVLASQLAKAQTTSHRGRHLSSTSTDLLRLDERDADASESWENVEVPLASSTEVSPLSSFIAESKSRSFPVLPVNTTGHSSAVQNGYKPQNPAKSMNWTSEQRVARYDNPDSDRSKGYFQHGIRFTPSSDIIGTHHRVVITGLPADITLASVMQLVRGGAVLSCELMSTTLMIGSNSAMVRFGTEDSAVSYAAFVAYHNISLNGQRIHCHVVHTPTYPLPATQYDSVHVKGHTRCLCIEEFLRFDELVSLERDIRHMWHLSLNAVELYGTDEGVLMVSFSSILYASQVKNMLATHQNYRRLTVRFVEDPCSRPLEDLLQTPYRSSDAPRPEMSQVMEKNRMDLIDL